MAPKFEGAAAVVTPEGKILCVNELLASWLGSSAGRLTGQDLPALLGAGDEQKRAALRDLLSSARKFDWAELPGREEPAGPRVGIEQCRLDDVRFLYFESALLAAPLPRPPAGASFKQRPDLSFSHVDQELENWTGIPLYDWHQQPGLFPNVIEDQRGFAAWQERADRNAPLVTTTFQFRHTLTGRLTRIRELRRLVFDHEGEALGYEGYWVDVSAQFTALERLLHSAWRENVGTLMLASLHDFCNIATAVVGLAQTAKADSEPESPLRAGLESVRVAAFAASQVAHRLQRWHTRVQGEKTFVDLNDSVRGMGEVLRKVLPRRIRLQTDLQEGQSPIEVDTFGLEQALVVLALNAAEAMPSGGEITLSTRSYDSLPELSRLFGTLPPPPLVALSVTDAGLGMSAN
ncbi:MAG TPA: hypothetical protein VHI52_07025, partial [Verrucomicrobiae bacterium]|nr:hypothetical protein [Verrucomicrobiae bacterium]